MPNLAQSKKLIKELIPKYINNGVPILQYADDTILCIQDDKEKAALIHVMKPCLG